MTPLNDKDRLRAQIRETSEALDRMRARELAAMTDEQAFRIIKSLRVPFKPWRDCPDWSGLVEQQAFFHRRRTT